MKKMFAVLAVLACTVPAFGQSFKVKVVDRQESNTEYNYLFANRHYATGGTLQLRGATLTLELPDGRAAVVNCESKFKERFAGPGNKRSCRVPLVDELQVEFKGDNAKLFWSVSLDGSKTQSETYKIVAIYSAQQQ
jgi:hypothetical protein